MLNDEDPCGGGLTLWELTRFSAADLPLTYGETPRDAKVWVNPLLSPDGSVVALEDGRSYTVSFYANCMLDENGRPGSDD